MSGSDPQNQVNTDNMIPVHTAVAHPWLCDIMGHMTTRHYTAIFDDASYLYFFRVFGWSGSDASSKIAV